MKNGYNTHTYVYTYHDMPKFEDLIIYLNTNVSNYTNEKSLVLFDSFDNYYNEYLFTPFQEIDRFIVDSYRYPIVNISSSIEKLKNVLCKNNNYKKLNDPNLYEKLKNFLLYKVHDEEDKFNNLYKNISKNIILSSLISEKQILRNIDLPTFNLICTNQKYLNKCNIEYEIYSYDEYLNKLNLIKPSNVHKNKSIPENKSIPDKKLNANATEFKPPLPSITSASFSDRMMCLKHKIQEECDRNKDKCQWTGDKCIIGNKQATVKKVVDYKNERNIGIFDPRGVNINPLNEKTYTSDYYELSKFWSVLPAYEFANKVTDSIINNDVILIASGTGSGKTVLVPKLALHANNYQGKLL